MPIFASQLLQLMQKPIDKPALDPFGCAMLDYLDGKRTGKLIVRSSLLLDDIMDIAYLFRDFNSMPAVEQAAVQAARGRVLDVGAGAGCHSRVIQQKCLPVTSIDISPGAVQAMKRQGLADVRHLSVDQLVNEKFDTILCLMNGAGIAGSLERFPDFLNLLAGLLAQGGQILIDSTDVSYMYENEKGDLRLPREERYWGEFDFAFVYGAAESARFDWVYIDRRRFEKAVQHCGFACEYLAENGATYLARLTRPEGRPPQQQ